MSKEKEPPKETPDFFEDIAPWTPELVDKILDALKKRRIWYETSDKRTSQEQTPEK